MVLLYSVTFHSSICGSSLTMFSEAFDATALPKSHGMSKTAKVSDGVVSSWGDRDSPLGRRWSHRLYISSWSWLLPL